MQFHFLDLIYIANYNFTSIIHEIKKPSVETNLKNGAISKKASISMRAITKMKLVLSSMIYIKLV